MHHAWLSRPSVSTTVEKEEHPRCQSPHLPLLLSKWPTPFLAPSELAILVFLILLSSSTFGGCFALADSNGDCYSSFFVPACQNDRVGTGRSDSMRKKSSDVSEIFHQRRVGPSDHPEILCLQVGSHVPQTRFGLLGEPTCYYPVRPVRSALKFRLHGH